MHAMGALIGVEIAQEFLSTVILTGRVKDAEPVSAVFIARPENGKTSIVLSQNCDSIVFLSKSTAMGLQQIVQTHRDASHIVFTDLEFVSGMAPKAAKNLLTTLLSLTEEGIRTVADPSGIHEIRSKKAIIACMTSDSARDMRRWWWRHGLARRMVPFHYQLSEPLVLQIKDTILSEQKLTWPESETIPVPRSKIAVALSKEIGQQILELSTRKAKQLETLGITLLKQFITLAKAHALNRSWKKAEVSEEDIQFLRRILPYIDWENPALL